MDKEVKKIIDEAAQKAATEAVAKVREFHQDDLKVLGERMDMGFESVDRRFDEVDKRFDQVEQRLDQVENRLDKVEQRLEKVEHRLDQLEDAFSTFLREFKEDKEKVRLLEAQVAELTQRVSTLEAQLATSQQ